MEEEKSNVTNQDKVIKTVKKVDRREVLKSLATLPALGAFAYGLWRKKKYDDILRKNLKETVTLSSESPVILSTAVKTPVIRVGIIGYGIRGEQLLKAAGYAHPDAVDKLITDAHDNNSDKRYEDFLQQEDLNISITAVCDLFEKRATRAQVAASNKNRGGTGKSLTPSAKIYKTYKELINAEDVDAVIFATPDHWHASLVLEAVRAGKHVYVEKGMTRTWEEAIKVRNAVSNSNIVFQLGHQGRKTESYLKAKEAVDKGIIGKVNLIEVTTNRNTPNGAWVYDIDPLGSSQTIDWQQFEEPCEKKHPFSLERFFRWRCWWDYGTGLSGDLLTHEYDGINQILRLGIPASAASSGGVYVYKDKSLGHYVDEIREVPDIWQAVLEYPHKDLSLLYTATLGNTKDRGKLIMGNDGYIELGNNLVIYADRNSIRYKDKIKSKIITPELPIFTYIPGKNNVDGISSPTEQYFAARGLLYTYRGGKRVDTTHLHIKEWIDCIRESKAGGEKKQTSCNINEAFQEAITAHMATLAYKENRRVYWDPVKEAIV
jgi:predicted dehydrogenase